jgi:hypothetical protein
MLTVQGLRGLRRPVVRQQFPDLTGPLRGQACEYVFQIGVRIVPIEFGTLDQAHHGCCSFARTQATRE